jgi:hypothetical protein
MPLLSFFLLLTLGTSFIYSQHAFSIPLQLQSLFSDESPLIFGKIMSINAVTVLLITPFLSLSFPRLSALQKMASAQLFYGLGFGLLILPVSKPFLFYISTLLWTTGEVLEAVNGGVFIANHSPSTHRGRFSSLYIISKGAGRSMAPLVAGFLMTRWNTTVLWTFILIFAGLLPYDKAQYS